MLLADTGAWEAGRTVAVAVFHPDVASAVAAAVRDAAGGRPSRS